MFKKKLTPFYIIKNIITVIGLVLIWRGIWYVLDQLDITIIIFGRQ